MGEITATSGSQIFTLLLWTVLSIAMVIIGSMHVNNCPVEPKIPIYLIVAGIFHLLAFVLVSLKKVAEKLAYSIESVLGIFSFCWFIAGSVWVFGVYQENPRHCNDLVYKFAFGILIFEYIFLAFVVAVICLCTCCAGLLNKNASKDTQTLEGDVPAQIGPLDFIMGRNFESDDKEAFAELYGLLYEGAVIEQLLVMEVLGGLGAVAILPCYVFTAGAAFFLQFLCAPLWTYVHSFAGFIGLAAADTETPVNNRSPEDEEALK